MKSNFTLKVSNPKIWRLFTLLSRFRRLWRWGLHIPASSSRLLFRSDNPGLPDQKNYIKTIFSPYNPRKDWNHEKMKKDIRHDKSDLQLKKWNKIWKFYEKMLILFSKTSLKKYFFHIHNSKKIVKFLNLCKTVSKKAEWQPCPKQNHRLHDAHLQTANGGAERPLRRSRCLKRPCEVEAILVRRKFNQTMFYSLACGERWLNVSTT